jgi:hypothetical protein
VFSSENSAFHVVLADGEQRRTRDKEKEWNLEEEKEHGNRKQGCDFPNPLSGKRTGNRKSAKAGLRGDRLEKVNQQEMKRRKMRSLSN